LLLKLKHSIMRGFSWNRIQQREKEYTGVRCKQIFATKRMNYFPSILEERFFHLKSTNGT
jgi:hypothetical protein